MARTVALVVALASASASGCSAIFMERLPSDHTAKSEPRCTATKGFAAWDTAIVVADLLAMALASTVVGVFNEENGYSEFDRALIIGVPAVSAIVHGISAGNGFGWADDCRDARRKRTEHVERVAVPPPLRGFYCSTSATMTGLCDREKVACEKTRAAIGGDLSACALVESAWCFGAKCVPTKVGCDVQRNADNATAACVETR